MKRESLAAIVAATISAATPICLIVVLPVAAFAAPKWVADKPAWVDAPTFSVGGKSCPTTFCSSSSMLSIAITRGGSARTSLTQTGSRRRRYVLAMAISICPSALVRGYALRKFRDDAGSHHPGDPCQAFPIRSNNRILARADYVHDRSPGHRSATGGEIHLTIRLGRYDLLLFLPCRRESLIAEGGGGALQNWPQKENAYTPSSAPT
jgi:hypothetical protein